MIFKPNGIITLTTDFSTSDGYAGAMKGVILSINPEAKVIDITHSIAFGDIRAGGWALFTSTSYFPAGSIHIAVVDPGVGSDRAPVMILTKNGSIYIGPDNGIFHFVACRWGIVNAWTINEKKVMINPISTTFHGRDVFAPAAAQLTKTKSPQKIARKINPDSLKKLDVDVSLKIKGGEIEATVIHVDTFGNIITSIPAAFLHRLKGGRVRQKRISGVAECYEDIEKSRIKFIKGSSGYIEISAKGKRAIEEEIRIGDKIVAYLKPT